MFQVLISFQRFHWKYTDKDHCFFHIGWPFQIGKGRCFCNKGRYRTLRCLNTFLLKEKKKNIRYCFGSGCGVRHLSGTLIFSQGLNISRGIIGGGGLTYPIPSSATPGSATDFQVTHEFLPRDFRTSRFGFMFSMFRQTPTSFPKKKNVPQNCRFISSNFNLK